MEDAEVFAAGGEVADDRVAADEVGWQAPLGVGSHVPALASIHHEKRPTGRRRAAGSSPAKWAGVGWLPNWAMLAVQSPCRRRITTMRPEASRSQPAVDVQGQRHVTAGLYGPV